LKTKRRRKKTRVNVHQDVSNECVNYQLKRPKVTVYTRLGKRLHNAGTGSFNAQA